MSTLLQIPLDLIDPNPWQPRQGEDHEHVKKLALSIAEHGLLQVASARQVPPSNPGDGVRYQLAFGHSRKAAYEFLHDASLQDPRWSSFPLNVVELSDRQMANAAAQENAQRKDLSAIEMAHAIQRYVKDFGVTQTEAGGVYGYASQSGVSNLLRLLQLPEEVQQKVHAGVLPERHAREMIQMARVNPTAVVKLAAAYQNCKDEGEKDSVIERGLADVARKSGQELQQALFKPEWPAKPIPAPDADGSKGEPNEIAACKGCAWHAKHSYGPGYCMRPACFQLKQRMFAAHDLARVSAKWGIAVASPAEAKGAALIYDGTQRDDDLAERILKSKHASLRFSGCGKKQSYGDYSRERVFGSSVVVLVSLDKPALMKALPKVKAADKPKSQYDIKSEKRNALSKQNEKLVAAAAEHFATALASVPDELVVALHEKVTYLSDKDKAIWQQRGAQARRVDLMQAVLMKRVADQNSYKPDPTRKTEAALVDLAKTLKVKLPNGWLHAAYAVPVNGKTKGKGGK